MGFTPKQKVYRITFDGHPELDGLILRAKSCPVGKFLDMTSLAANLDPGARRQQLTQEEIDQMAGLFQGFADALIEWNLETESGEPVPPSLEGIRTLDLDTALDVILTWPGAIADVAAPLDSPSSNGATSAALSMPMEISSPSQQS